MRTYRINLQSELAKETDAQLISILMEGGVGSLQETQMRLHAGLPLIVLGNTGRMADVICYTFSLSDDNNGFVLFRSVIRAYRPFQRILSSKEQFSYMCLYCYIFSFSLSMLSSKEKFSYMCLYCYVFSFSLSLCLFLSISLSLSISKEQFSYMCLYCYVFSFSLSFSLSLFLSVSAPYLSLSQAHSVSCPAN